MDEFGQDDLAREEMNPNKESSSSTPRMMPNNPKKKRRQSIDLDKAAQGMSVAANRLADAFAHTDCARLQEELDSIPGLSSEDFLQAMHLLGQNATHANIFFHLAGDRKKQWLLMYLKQYV
jgi:hypothetical protein